MNGVFTHCVTYHEFDKLIHDTQSNEEFLNSYQMLYKTYGIYDYSVYPNMNVVVLFFNRQSCYNMFVLGHTGVIST